VPNFPLYRHTSSSVEKIRPWKNTALLGIEFWNTTTTISSISNNSNNNNNNNTFVSFIIMAQNLPVPALNAPLPTGLAHVIALATDPQVYETSQF
jgi:hypothetical protein